jgi:hypothetical protein
VFDQLAGLVGQRRRLGFQAEALQGGLNAWRSAYPVESTSDAVA